MGISEKEFKNLVALVGRLNSTVESSTKKINEYSEKLEKALKETEALKAQVEKLLKATAACLN